MVHATLTMDADYLGQSPAINFQGKILDDGSGSGKYVVKTRKMVNNRFLHHPFAHNFCCNAEARAQLKHEFKITIVGVII